MASTADFVLKTDDVFEYIKYRNGLASSHAPYFQEAELFHYLLLFPANSWFEISDRIRLERVTGLNYENIEESLMNVESGMMYSESICFDLKFLNRLIQLKVFDDSMNLSENLTHIIKDFKSADFLNL
jgi:hypothetical protein